ncbi:MAG: PilN domain-containing protein [Solirubrobacterales bacterium]
MRPVNLIPAEERRGEHAPLRTGPAVYLLVGALVVVLVAVTAMVLFDNQIGERESEVASLQREDEVVAAKATRLARYTEFQTMSERRAETVRSLADSRFDWERVMRELSLVLPDDVSLVGLEATAGGAEESSVGGATGPTLSLSGCAAGQEGVARFVTALKDIDGVTRVGLESSALEEGSDDGAAASTEVGAATGPSGSCGGAASVATFEMLVAFDAAPVPGASAEGEASAEEVTSETDAGGEEG